MAGFIGFLNRYGRSAGAEGIGLALLRWACADDIDHASKRQGMLAHPTLQKYRLGVLGRQDGRAMPRKQLKGRLSALKPQARNDCNGSKCERLTAKGASQHPLPDAGTFGDVVLLMIVRSPN
jgi:hypothetical protein